MKQLETIVYSGLIKAKHIRDIFHVSVNTEGKLVPLCQVHYKQVHCMINPQKYIGLTNIDTTSDDIIAQLSSIDTNLKLLHINKLIEALYEDPDLSSILTSTRAKTLQILLRHTTLDSNGFLAFICLVGVAYFEKNRGAFDDDNPTYFNSVSDQCITEKHKNGIMRSEPRCRSRIAFEDQLPTGCTTLRSKCIKSGRQCGARLWMLPVPESV